MAKRDPLDNVWDLFKIIIIIIVGFVVFRFLFQVAGRAIG